MEGSLHPFGEISCPRSLSLTAGYKGTIESQDALLVEYLPLFFFLTYLKKYTFIYIIYFLTMFFNGVYCDLDSLYRKYAVDAC